MSAVMIDPVVPLAVRCAFVALFAAALVHKLRAPGPFANAVQGYVGLLWPDKSVRYSVIVAIALSVGAIEASLLVLLLLPVQPEWQAASCATVLLSYSLLMGWSILRGHQIDCGCSFGATRQRVGRGTVFRNLALAAGTTLMFVPSNNRTLTVADFTIVVALLTVAALVYQIVNQLLANAGNLPRST